MSEPDPAMVAGTRTRAGRPAGMRSDSPAKFAVPVATRVIARPRLHTRLTAGLESPVTLIAAAAGWGKSLLVASWIAAGAAGTSVAWVSLDRGDDDVRAFWATLASALVPAADEASAEALRRLPGDAAEAELPGEFVRALERAERPFVLVLDNLHEVTAAAVHAGLVRLVERPPSMLSLVITTRRDPPWPLPRLRLAGLVTEVRATDLAFSADEAEVLFGQLGVQLTDDQIDEMVARTEGWAAGIRLGALHLRGARDVGAAVTTFSGDDHSVSGYLLEEVLDRQTPELLAFLEKISTVDLVCGDLADALTGARDGAPVLAELAASHLFVQALGRPGRWYRLHRLVLDVLRARPLPRRERRDLHRRAALWFADRGMTLEAVRSAVRGELWPLAAELVSSNLVGLALRGSARELERILTEVPRPVLLVRPELATALAGVRVAQGRQAAAESLVEAARQRSGDLAERRADRLRLHHGLILGGLARVVGDLPAALDAYRRVPLDPATLTGLGVDDAEIVMDVVRSNLGTAELWTGDLAAAEAHLREAADLGGAAPGLPHVNAFAHLAVLFCDRGDLDAAEEAATTAVAAATASGWVRALQLSPAYLAMARVVFDRGDLLGADTWLGRLADVEEHGPEPHVRLAGSLFRAARHEAADDPERALAELRSTRARLGEWTPPQPLADQWVCAEAALLARAGDTAAARAVIGRAGPPVTDSGALVQARLHLRLGDHEATGEMLDRADGPSPRGHTGAGVIGALLAIEVGDDERALNLLEDALLAAAAFGLRRPFLAEPGLADLLAERVERGSAASEFALDLLGRLTGAQDRTGERTGLVDPLTERERTALRYLASALSNTEIAGELYVSVNTVKTHQRAVYRKLGATGRRDAVRRARALNLL